MLKYKALCQMFLVLHLQEVQKSKNQIQEAHANQPQCYHLFSTPEYMYTLYTPAVSGRLSTYCTMAREWGQFDSCLERV